MPSSPRVSVIVPARDCAAQLADCLLGLLASVEAGTEVIVVDDASTDDSAVVASRFGVRVVRLRQRAGPAGARNAGAGEATGDVLWFVDADVVVAPDALRRIARAFGADPGLAAVFGSYDDCPRAPGLVSQYRNLLHRFVHQTGRADATTFWAGCGAIRRSVFEAVGGFDAQTFPEPSIEDIELGYRLRRAGHRILLDKALQGTHLKRWTLWSVARTDVFHRAIPWSRLILEHRVAPDDLNLKRSQWLSVGLVGLMAVLVGLAPFRVEALALAGAVLLGVVALNRALFVFFARARGVCFAAACLPLQLLFFLYSGLSFAYVWLMVRPSRARMAGHAAPDPVPTGNRL